MAQLLAIDIGNTHLTLGIWDGHDGVSTAPAYVPQRTRTNTASTCARCCATPIRLSRIDRRDLASVVPALTATFQRRRGVTWA